MGTFDPQALASTLKEACPLALKSLVMPSGAEGVENPYFKIGLKLMPHWPLPEMVLPNPGSPTIVFGA